MFDSDNMHDKSNLDWSVFDAIYLINLRERTDRRRELEAELCSVGLLPGDPKLIWLNAVRPETSERTVAFSVIWRACKRLRQANIREY